MHSLTHGNITVSLQNEASLFSSESLLMVNMNLRSKSGGLNSMALS